jgi:4-alpha-glucanotransferase
VSVSPPTRLPDVVRFGREICGDLAQAERREWWLVNGRGAYAAGTVAGSLTRRYHGLLVAPLEPPLGRYLVLAKADATLSDGEREWPLFTNRWRDGTVSPAGHVHVESFRLEGRLPVWTFSVRGARVEQRVWMEAGSGTTWTAWRLLGETGSASTWRLRVTLLANERDHHCTTRCGAIRPGVAVEDGRLRVELSNRRSLTIACQGGTLRAEQTWHESFALGAEAERGLESVDNHLCVGVADLSLEDGRWAGVVASIEPAFDASLEASLERAVERERSLLTRAETAEPALRAAPDRVRQLVLSADGFLFSRTLPDATEAPSVIAGYPWFGEWGRDTMIALPGLALATGRPEHAREVLLASARFIDRGMLPNTYPEVGGAPEYNSVDAALWYVEAWRAYLAATADLEAVTPALPALEDIIGWHLEGTRYGIGADPTDGLLHAGEPGVQLTWMDAKVGDWVVTPRMGKPVEVNALWYSALRFMASLGSRTGHPGAREYAHLADRARNGFQRFVRPDGGGLYDVIDGPNGDDPRVRPNQVLAVSLHYSPLDLPAQRAVVERCGRDLLTSYGLRSLADTHPDYRPHYRGRVWERDEAYHQGTVWPWLLGHYALAYCRVHRNAPAAQALLTPLLDHLFDAGLGTVSEIFDGAPPHTPRGAPSQAWSVACVLDAWWRLEGARLGRGGSPPCALVPLADRGPRPGPGTGPGRAPQRRQKPG